MIENKKIAFLCHPYHRGGVTRWMADAAVAFADKGWEVYFVTVAPSVVFISGKGRETLVQLLQKAGGQVRIISKPVGRAFEFGTGEYRAYVYKQLLQQLPIGTPVILSDDGAVWEAATALHTTYPVIGVLHADEEQYYALAEKYYRQVAVFACVSERVNRKTRQRVPGIGEAIYTIPCGINLPAVSNTRHEGDMLQLVYVGRVSEYQKRVSDLVNVCILLVQDGLNFHLNIIGDGEDRVSLEHKFNEAGLGGRVTFYGWLAQQEVGDRLAAADILVLTSDFEGTPIAMMEALAAGCGIAGTRVSGIEDYEQHTRAADCFAVFDVGDIQNAVSKIRKLSAVPVAVRRVAARELAEDEFSMQVCLERYSKAISTIPQVKAQPVRVSLALQKRLSSGIIAFARYMKVRIKH